MTVYALTDTKKGEQGLRPLIFKLPLMGLIFYTTKRIRVNAFVQWRR